MELSVLIPARNERWLARTVKDLLEHIEADTEILVGLDGEWADPVIRDHPRVKIFHVCESIGQREMTNQLARLAKGRYLMKVDAHCAFDQGFDKKMLEAFKETGDNVAMVPTMRNLHAFDWVCECGFRHYQDKGKTCPQCGKTMVIDERWIPKSRPESNSYCFDSEPHFQYFNEYTKRPGWGKELEESMSIQGSCFMVTKEMYFRLNLCDETLGSWGSQGIEVACKTWLSGGRVVINRRTWYAHMFRTKQENDFGFPYEIKIKDHKRLVKDLFWSGAWEHQTRPLSWLVKKFWPIPPTPRSRGWTEDDLTELIKLEGGKIET